MKKLLIIAVVAFSSHSIYAQSTQDTIVIKRGAFTQNGKVLMPKHLLEITKNNPIAFEHMQQAKKNYAPAVILGFIGGAGIGYPLGGLIAGKQMNWTVFGAGAGFIVASLPFSTAYNKHAKKAVITYNGELQKVSYKRVFLQSTLCENGLGIKATF